MRGLLFVCLMAVILVFGGCKEVKAPKSSVGADASALSEAVMPVDTMPEFKLPPEVKAKARELVNDSTYIDFDVDAVVRRILKSGRASIDPDTMAMTMAAVYRFWSVVTVKDNLYEIGISSPEEIRVSQRIFDNMVSNVATMNRLLKEDMAKGDDVNVEPITEEYLESLLN